MHLGNRLPGAGLLYTDQLDRLGGDVFGGDFEFFD